VTSPDGVTPLDPTVAAPDVHRRRVWFLFALGALMVVVMFLVPRIPQDPGYHGFADQRTCLGVPNCLNVASNLPFLVVGILGFLFLVRQRAARGTDAFIAPAERQPYWVLFAGVGLTGIGSAYYHWAPDNATLFWDRLPMTIAFMAILSSVIAERINLRVGLALLWPLLVIGALSTLYWHLGELRGVGDLRPYALVQFGTMVAIPLILWLFPPRYTGTLDLVWVIAWYGLAKIFEHFDHGFFQLTGGVSGHTLKHLASAVGAWWILRMLERRRPLVRAA
jgi:Ceramidase